MPFDDNWLRQDGMMGGRFQVESVLKDGKYSVVYRMQDTRDNRPCILRVLLGGTEPGEAVEFQEAFNPAWAAVSRIEHKMLPPIIDAFSLEGRTYVLRQMVPGRSLLSYIQSSEPVDESLIRDWGAQLCELLKVLHERRVYLGVLRPNDVWIQPDGTVWLADYGPLLFWPAGRRKTMVKEWLGGMVPPEVAKGGDLRASSDVYALGALLHYVLTRIKPRSAGPLTMLGKHRQDVSRDFNRVIMRCLSFSPDGRYDSMDALKTALLGEAPPAALAAGADMPAVPSQGLEAASMLQVTPPQLLFMDVHGKRAPAQRLTVVSTLTDDTIQILPIHPWIQVSPEFIQGSRGEVAVTVDPRALNMNEVTQGEVLVSGKRRKVTVPVSASLRATGLSWTGLGASVMLQLLVPALMGAATVGIHGFLRTRVLSLLVPHSKHHVLDLTDATLIGHGFAVWLLVQTLLMPLVALLVFQQTHNRTRPRLVPAYVLSLLEPLLLLWLIADASAPIKEPSVAALMNGGIYLPEYVTCCVAGVVMFTQGIWAGRVPQGARTVLTWVSRLAVAGAFVAGLVQIFH